MKKSLFSLGVVLSMAALVFVAYAPVTAQAQTAVACPAGFVCTPINPVQSTSCPTGYVCTPVVPVSSGGGGSTSSCYVFSKNLTIGNTGADVVALQTWLIGAGYQIPLITSGQAAKGYFGPSTSAALGRYQAAVGLPATGVLDVMTRASINGSCATTTPTPISGTQINASLDPSSPQSSTIQISQTSATQNVPLAVFDLESLNSPSTLQSFCSGINVSNSSGRMSASSLFTNIFIRGGGQTYAESGATADGQTVSFSNLNIPLPANVQIPITIYGSVAQDTNNSLDGYYASANLPQVCITAIGSDYNSVPVVGQGVMSLLSGSTMMFTSATIPTVNSIYPTSANPGQMVTINGSNFLSPYSLVEFSLNTKGGGATENVSPNSLSSSQISVIVPSDLPAGSYSVTVANLSGGKGGGQSVDANSWLQFTVNSNGTSCTTNCGSPLPTCPAGYTCQTSQGSLSVYLTDASSDMAGIWGVFGPGTGRVNGNNPYDWHFSTTVTLPTAKTISCATLIVNDGSTGFSTCSTASNALNKELYPMVIYPNVKGGGALMDSAYNQQMSISSGTTNLDMYGQPERSAGSTFPGGTLTLAFTDGTSLTATVPASSVAIPSVSPTQQSSITVLSPKNGDVYTVGAPVSITWGGSWSGNDTFNIQWGTAMSSGGEKGGPIVTTLTQAQAGCSGYGKGVCSYSWTPTYQTGPIQITVFDNVTNANGISGSFTVNPASTPVTTQQPSITVLSPNGGETYQIASPINITWSASNLTKNGQNNIELINSSGADFFTIYATNILTGTSYSWTPDLGLAPGNYKIRIKSTDPATGVTVSDDSNGFFTIASSVSPIPTTSSATISAALADASSDKAGVWGVFGPGAGRINNNNPYDWHFQSVLTISGAPKTLQSLTVASNDGWSSWSTSDSSKYPLVVFSNGVQVNSSYGSSFGTLQPGTDSFDLYGQPELPSGSMFPGGTLKATFTDGTTATSQIGVDGVKIPVVQVTTTSASASAYDASNSAGNAAVVELCSVTHWSGCLAF